MLKNDSREASARGKIVLGVGAAVFAASALWLVWIGDTGVRYSADHGETVPMWVRWIPAVVGIALVRALPSKAPAIAPRGRVDAAVLLGSAVAFATSLRLVGGGEPAHTLLKLTLLLGVPAAMFWTLRPNRTAPPPQHETTSWQRFSPAIPVAAWLILSYWGPFATPSSDTVRQDSLTTLLIIIVVGFLFNSLLEEVFYRRWLQTCWESLLGRWPAIVLASLLWAAWHVGIHGTGAVHVDLAHVFVNQGVLGLFLGYLWSKYRTMWPILVVHGAVNAAPLLLA